MNPKLAQILFIITNLIAVPVIGYAFYEFFIVKTALANGEQQIPFDSGTYYLLLGSIFWVLLVVQIFGKRNPNSRMLNYASPAIIIWFIAMLILANVIPSYLKSKLESAGYTKCDDPAEISRVSKGASSIYVKGSCPNS